MNELNETVHAKQSVHEHLRVRVQGISRLKKPKIRSPETSETKSRLWRATVPDNRDIQTAWPESIFIFFILVRSEVWNFLTDHLVLVRWSLNRWEWLYDEVLGFSWYDTDTRTISLSRTTRRAPNQRSKDRFYHTRSKVHGHLSENGQPYVYTSQTNAHFRVGNV